MKQTNKSNNSSIRNRLILFLEHINEKHEDFYTKTGFSNSFLRQKKSCINSDSLSKISEVYIELNLNWLITGMGSLVKPYFCFTNLKLKLKGNEKVAEIPVEQLLESQMEFSKYLYLSLQDAQKTIREKDEKISELEKRQQIKE